MKIFLKRQFKFKKISYKSNKDRALLIIKNKMKANFKSDIKVFVKVNAILLR